MSERTDFAAPWGASLRVTSTLVSLVLLGVAALGLWVVPPGERGARAAMIALPLLILAGTAPFMVRGYGLGPGQLAVRRPGWATRLELAGLTAVAPDPEAMRGSIRLWGNGGMFSFSGWFSNRKLGRYRAFVTDPARAVVLRWPDRVVVISPDDPEAFTRAVRAMTTG